jgi:hypothetical protein
MELDFFLKPLFVFALLSTALSIVLFQYKKVTFSLSLLFGSAMLLGLFIASLDPFIHLWDEIFHALVAKNLLCDPLKPVLIEKPLFGTTTYWGHSEIWLHKQPLFLWQIAASFKIFGFNEIALRLPSVLMHGILVVIVYRFGKILCNSAVGYTAALLFTWAYFPLEFISGYYATDHNDNSFLFYSFSSIWALVEYRHSKNMIFLILIGLFSGAAILCKWLTGLLVFAVWGLLIVKNLKSLAFKQELVGFILALLVCIAVVLPWQLYAYSHYPMEYSVAMAFNMKHIFQPLEGHAGDTFFYYTALYEQFGEGVLIPISVLLCFAFLVYRLDSSDKKILILSSVFLTYLFFSLVRTKMLGYVFVVIPIFIFSIAYSIQSAFDKGRKLIKQDYLMKITQFSILSIFIFFLCDYHKIYKHHGGDQGSLIGRTIKIKEKELFNQISDRFKGEETVIFNCNTTFGGQNYAIFYTGYPSFNFIPNKDQLEKVKRKGYRIVCIDSGSLPKWLLNDTNVVKYRFRNRAIL